MDNKIHELSTKYSRKRLLKRAVSLLCVVVLLFTMNTLKRNANTLERIPTCGLAEHSHSSACYNKAGKLVCGMQEHVHTDACYQEAPKKRKGSKGDLDINLDGYDDSSNLIESGKVQNLDVSLDLDQGGLLDFVQDPNNARSADDNSMEALNGDLQLDTSDNKEKGSVANNASSQEQEVTLEFADEKASSNGRSAANMQPTVDQPAADQPVADQPAADQPVADQPVADQPVADQPAADQPVAEQPAVDQPVADQPVADQPTDDAQQPVADQPTDDAQQPVADQPTDDAQQPVADQPTDDAQQPVADQPTDDAQQPVADQPTDDAQQPAADVDQPSVDQPAADDGEQQPSVDAQLPIDGDQQLPGDDQQVTVDVGTQQLVTDEQKPVADIDQPSVDQPTSDDDAQQPAADIDQPAADQPADDDAQQPAERRYTATVDMAGVETYPISLRAVIANAVPAEETNIESNDADAQAPDAEAQSAEEETVLPMGEWSVEFDPDLFEIENTEDDILLMPLADFESTEVELYNGSRYALTLVNCVLQQPQTEAEPQAEIAYPAQHFEDSTDYISVVVDAPVGALPEGTVMVLADVVDQGTIDNIEQSVTEDFVEVKSVHAVDITFLYNNAEIEPKQLISVVMRELEAEESHPQQDTVVVHVDNDGAAQVVASEATTEPGAPEAQPTAQAFEADAFSVYALVKVEKIETKYIDDAGETWSIKLAYTKEARIPEGSTLQVAEVKDEGYLTEAEAALESGKRITKARFFDIKIMDKEGQEVQPQDKVQVIVTLDGDEGTIEVGPEQTEVGDSAVCAMHFVEQNDEVVKVEKKEAEETDSGVQFDAEGFSVWGVVYTVEFEVEGDQGEITLDFTAFDALTLPGAGDICYNTEDCSIHVALSLLSGIVSSEAEAGYDIDVNADLVNNYEFDFAKAEMGKADSGIRFEGGELVIEADGFVELTEGERLLRVRATGLTALKEAQLETEGASIEVVEGNVPLGSEASFTAHTEEETAQLVENYINNNEENGDSEVAGYSAADLKIVRNEETLPVEGQFKVTVDKESLVPVGMKLDKLYHIHDGAVEPLDVNETEAGLEFTMTGFSDIVASYTVDLEYEGIQWSLPGFGSYSIASIMSQIGVEGRVDSADLLLLEGEEVENALYMEQDQDGTWYLCSYAPFDEVYRLTVVVDGATYILTVTDDEQAWNVTVNLFDYDGSSAATSAEMSVIQNKKYGVLAVVTDKTTGELVGYKASGFAVDSNPSSTISGISVGQNYLKVHVEDNKVVEDYQWANYDSQTQNVSFRLYEGNIAPDQWQYQSYSTITSLPDSMTGFEFLAEPYGNKVNGDSVTLNLKRAYDKRYNIRFNIEPADMGISAEDEYYAFVTVEHATSGNTYGWTKITIPKGQSTVDFPITTWYNWNGNELPNEKFTGNERVTVQLYTTNQKPDGTKDGFANFNNIKDSQVKVLVAEGSSINRYNLYYGTRTSENVDASHLTNYYDNLYLRAPNGNISKGDIDALLEDATDFGYYTNRYVGHSGDIEATIGADFMDTDFLADFGYSSANVNVNRLKVLKIYTDNQGRPVQKPVEIRLKQNGVVVATKTGTTNAEGKLEVEFDGLNSGEYEIDEIIDGKVVSGQGSAQVTGETIYYNFSIDKAHFANNKNVNYFGTIGPNQDLDKLKTMLQKASRVDVVILTDTTKDKARIDAAKETQTTGKQIDVLLNGTGGYKKYNIPNDMLRLKQLSDDLASAQSSSTVRVVNAKASEMSENGMYFEDDGRYIVINIEMDQDTFCPMCYLDGQLLDCDYGQSGKSNSSHVLYNLRHNGTYYDGDVNTSKLGAGVILAPAANAHILGGPFGGTIITDRVNRAGNELHSNNPNQIQTLNATIQNTIGSPTTGSLELRKEFSNTSIKDKVTYFTFEVQLHNDDITKVQDQSFPASGLKKGDSVTFDAEGKAQVLVRAGNSVSIANLPAGTTFTVKEISTPETAHFTLDHYEVNEERSDTGTIVAGDTQKAKVLNTVKTADLTIEKAVAGTTDEDKEFEFTLVLENKTSGEGETEVWEAYPDTFSISIAGGEYHEVSGPQTFRLKAGQKAQLQGLKDDGDIIRYRATETAVYINDVRYEINPDNQPVKGYSNSDLVVQNGCTAGDHVVYVNKYSAETRVKFVAHKVMRGSDLAENEFTFELREGSPTGTVIGTAKQNAADGTVTFDDIEYQIEHRTGQAISDCMAGATIKADGTREKIFTYYICEVEDPAKTDVAFAAPVEVKVKVVDDGLGTLRVYDMEGNQITEYTEDETTHRLVLGNHTYTLPAAKNIVNTLKTQQTLEGTKTLTGRDMTEGEKFYFNVTETVHNPETDADEDVVVATGEATGGADGQAVSIAFTPIEYKYSGVASDYPQTHTYAIAEDNSKLSSDLKQNSQVVYARVVVSYDAAGHALSAGTPEYSLDGSAWSGSADLVSFINTQDTIGFTVTKEWYVASGDAAYAPRTITFSVKREGEDFDLTNETVEQTNPGVGSFTKLGNTVTLNAGESGWPVVAIRDVLKGTYVVTETAFTGQADGTTVETTYSLNAGAFQATTPGITADNDALVIKNTETDHVENPAELTLKKIWDSSVPANEKKTVTYELYRVETSASGSSGGENSFVVMFYGNWGSEIDRTTVHYDNIGDSVSVTVTNPTKASTGYTVQNNGEITVSTTGAVAQVNFIVTDYIAQNGLILYDYTGNSDQFTGARIEAGGSTPLVVTQLTATPTDHATVMAMGGKKVREVELDAEHWDTGVTFEVSKGTETVAYQYYVVEKDGDRTQAQYTKTGDSEITVTNFKDETVSVNVKKAWNGGDGDAATLYLLRFTKDSDVTPESSDTPEPASTDATENAVHVKVNWVFDSSMSQASDFKVFTQQFPFSGSITWTPDSNQNWHESTASTSYEYNYTGVTSEGVQKDYAVQYGIIQASGNQWVDRGNEFEMSVQTTNFSEKAGNCPLIRGNASKTQEITITVSYKNATTEPGDEPSTEPDDPIPSGDTVRLTILYGNNGTDNILVEDSEIAKGSTVTINVTSHDGFNAGKYWDLNSAIQGYDNVSTTLAAPTTSVIRTDNYWGQDHPLTQYTFTAVINSDTGIGISVMDNSGMSDAVQASYTVTPPSTASLHGNPSESPFQLVFNPFVAYADESGIISGDVSVSGVDYSALNTEGYTLDTSFGKAVTLASPIWEYTFDGLPKTSASGQPYYYAMVEGPVSGYNVEYDHTGPVAASTLASDTLVTLKATNTPKTGDLSVTKTVATGYTDKAFSFTVTLGDTSVNGTYGDMTFANGVATFMLKHNQTKTATGLPADISYEVVESSAAGYTATYSGATGTIPDGAEASATVTNNYSSSGSVPFKAKKTLEGGDLAANQFRFTLVEYTDNTFQTVKDGGVSQSKGNAIGGDIAFDEVALADTATRYFKIKETVPTGQNADGTIIYDTRETNVTVTVNDDGEGHLIASKSPAADTNGYDASFVNTKKGALTVTKAVTVNNQQVTDNTKPSLADGTYTFTVTGPSNYSNTGSITVTNGVAQSSIELTGLTPGEYIVTEDAVDNHTTLTGRNGDSTGTDGERGIKLNVAAGDLASANVAAFTNNVNTGEATVPDSVTVNKQDDKGTALPGAMFTLYSTNTEGTLSGEVATYGGSDVSSFTINTGDSALASYLPTTNGGSVTLYLKETEAPSGYLLSDTIYNVVITTSISELTWNEDSGKYITTTTYTMTIGGGESQNVPNTPKTGSVTFTQKKTFTNGAQATKFGYSVTEYTDNTYGKVKLVITDNGEMSASENGVTTVYYELEDVGHHYYIVKENLPTGVTPTAADKKNGYIIHEGVKYDLKEYKYDVEVSIGDTALDVKKDSVTVGNIDTTFTNEQLGQLEITKRVVANGEGVTKSGTFWYAVFKAADVNSETRQPISGRHTVSYGSIVVDASGTGTATVNDLSYGDYYVFELEGQPSTDKDGNEHLSIIPDGTTMAIVTTVYTVTDSGTTAATVGDTPGEAGLTNTVPETDITAEKTWKPFTRDLGERKNPVNTTLKLTLTRYTVSENENGNKVYNGETPVGTVTISTDANGTITKSDGTNTTTVTLPDTSASAYEAEYNAAWSYTWENLPLYGSTTDVRYAYRVTETVDNNLFSRKDNENSDYLPKTGLNGEEITTQQFTNVEKSPVALPATGGVGTGVIYGAGAALLLLAVLGLILRNKKRGEGAGIR